MIRFKLNTEEVEELLASYFKDIHGGVVESAAAYYDSCEGEFEIELNTGVEWRPWRKSRTA